MELTLKLSPLVYAEIYKLLAQQLPNDPEKPTRFSEALEDRLHESGQPLDWLPEAAAAYERRWIEYGPEDTLGKQHGLLAGWVLAGLRTVGHSWNFNHTLNEKITSRAAGHRTRSGLLPTRFRPRVIAWTLGVAVGEVDVELPAIPIRYPNDEQIAKAYECFVEFCMLLNTAIKEPWPELVGSATYVRGAGLAEILKPGFKPARQAVVELLKEARLSAHADEVSAFNRHFLANFFENRNTLVHLLPDKPSDPQFTDLTGVACGWSEVRPTVSGITHFVFQRVSEELAASREVNEQTWDIKWELHQDW